MKLPIDFRLLATVMINVTSLHASAQVVAVDPVQEVAIMVGTDSVSRQINRQVKAEEKVLAEQVMIKLQANQIKNWEEKYNKYLCTAQGYANKLQATATVVTDALQTLIRLNELRKAVADNPQGLVSTASMNNLYAECVFQFVEVFRLFKTTLAKGGGYKNKEEKGNMLNGKERTELLWDLSSAIADLNDKFHHLALSISYYNLTDVWNKLTLGIIPKDHEQIANEAYERWQRAYRVSCGYSGR